MERCEPHVERLFLGGLLHDIGRLAMYLKLPAESSAILERCAQNAEFEAKVETEIIGFDHAELGGALLEWWKLPASLADMVRYHHRPTFSRISITESALIHTADFLVNALELGNSGEHLIPPLSAEAWRRTQLSEGCLERIMQDIEKQTMGMAQILTH
jgi:HD-like signal output (HDOD) protein